MNTSRQYASIDVSEFESFLADNGEFSRVTDTNANEAVYAVDLPHPELQIRVFSTIEEGKSRSRGSDAIRTVIWHVGQDAPVSGRTKTLRIKTWRKNLSAKLADLMENWQDDFHGDCHECDGIMAQKSGKYGDFLGCSNYPNCRATRDIGEEAPEENQESDTDGCPECSGRLAEREGKFGKFLGCTNYPVCRHTENVKKIAA